MFEYIHVLVCKYANVGKVCHNRKKFAYKCIICTYVYEPFMCK